MPTNDEINTAFTAIHPDLQKLVTDFVPSFYQSAVLQDLASQQGIVDIVGILRKALTAAEAARAKAAPPKAP
jgi:hypothetical protein